MKRLIPKKRERKNFEIPAYLIAGKRVICGTFAKRKVLRSWGFEMLPVNVCLDRIVLIIQNVTLEQFEEFMKMLESHQVFYPNTIFKQGISSKASAYRYNANFGYGEGGIRIDYKHNSLPADTKRCDMRLEFNPQKLDFQKYEYILVNQRGLEIKKYADPCKVFFELFTQRFLNDATDSKKEKMGISTGHRRIIREIDIACDFNVPIEKIMITSLTGKEMNLVKGTKYWGGKHEHGYLKMYDKKKERLQKKGKDLWKYEKYEHLTRIEYTMRTQGDVGINELSRIKDFEISSLYQMVVLEPENMEELDPTIKAYVLCYLNNLMPFKEFSRRYREKTKKALASMSQISLDTILKEQFKTNILSTINKYIRY